MKKIFKNILIPLISLPLTTIIPISLNSCSKSEIDFSHIKNVYDNPQTSATVEDGKTVYSTYWKIPSFIWTSTDSIDDCFVKINEANQTTSILALGVLKDSNFDETKQFSVILKAESFNSPGIYDIKLEFYKEEINNSNKPFAVSPSITLKSNPIMEFENEIVEDENNYGNASFKIYPCNCLIDDCLSSNIKFSIQGEVESFARDDKDEKAVILQIKNLPRLDLIALS